MGPTVSTTSPPPADQRDACPQCGRPLPQDAPRHLCPECLLRLCLQPQEDEPGAETAFAGAFVRFDDYEILAEIGRGGMGIVYQARQVSLGRVVALKMLTPARLLSRQDTERFQVEAAAVAKLDHPNILPIYDFGRKSGQCFYTMRLVEGGNLADRIARGEFSVPGAPAARAWQERIARLLATLAEAVQHAHEQGVIHRDLKPANILIDSTDCPFVADFGLAKLADGGADLTQSQASFGTPSYMAPEQVGGGARRLTAHADVYGLGAIFYELLTGRKAFPGENTFDVLRKIRDEEPAPPRSLQPLVDRDLEILCLKCLEKEPRNRFPGAAALSDELRRWLRRAPIESRPATSWERLLKWYRREPIVAGLATTVALAIAAGLTVSLAQASKARQAAARAEALNTRLELEIAENMFAADQSGVALAYLANVLRRDPMNNVAAQRLVSALSERGFCIPLPDGPRHREVVADIRLSQDGRFIASLAANSALISDLATGQPITGFLASGGTVHSADFSKDSKRLATAADDGARIWDAATGALLTTLRGETGFSKALFHPDGARLLATGTHSNAWFFDLASGQPAFAPLATGGFVWRAALSPDGAVAALACASGQVLIWDCRTGALKFPPLPHRGAVFSCEFNADGSLLVSAGDDGYVRVWDMRTGHPAREPLFVGARILHARFSPDGSHVASAGDDGTAWAWDLKTGQKVSGPLQHVRPVSFVDFSPDGRLLLTSSFDRTARLWDWKSGRPASEPLQCLDEVRRAEFSLDGRRIVTRSLTTNVLIWNVKTPPSFGMTLRLPGRISSLAISPGNRRALAVGLDRRVRVWDLWANPPSLLTLSPSNAVGNVVFSPAADRVIVGCTDGSVQFWDATSGQLLTSRRMHDGEVQSIRFSQDGKSMLTTSYDTTAKLWEFPSARPIATFHHTDVVRDADLSPDGRLLATTTGDRRAWIWEVASGRLLHGPLPHNYTIHTVFFSKDARTISTYSGDRIARQWDVRTGAPVGETGRPLGLTSDNINIDRSRAVATTHDNSALVKDCETGRILVEPIRHEAAVNAFTISQDGQIVVTASADGVVQVRTVPYLPLPVPGWVPALAEAISGQRIGASSAPELTWTRLLAIPSDARSAAETTWQTWARGLLAPASATNPLRSYWPN